MTARAIRRIEPSGQTGSRPAAGARPGRGGAAGARQAEDLLRRRRRRRQDLRDARGRPRPPDRGRRRRGRLGRDPRPGRDRGAPARARAAAAPDGRVPRHDACASSTSTPPSPGARPSILVDELAHTNAPGSRHAKRWQDVTELLDAGIDVYTTLNVQHLESLNDVVARVTEVVDAGNGAGLDPRAGGRGRAGGPPADDLIQRLEGGEGLRPRAGRGGRAALLPQGQPDRAPGAGAADDRGAGGRPDGGLPARPRRAGNLARGRAHPGLRQPQPPGGAGRPGGPPDGGRAAAPSGWSSYVETPGHGPASRTRTGTALVQTLRLAEQLGAETVDAHGPRRRRGGPHVRPPPERHQDRPRQAGAAPLAGGPVRLGRRRAGAAERGHRRLRHHRGARRAAGPAAAQRPAPPVDWHGYVRAVGVVAALHGGRRWLHVPLLRARQPRHGVPAGRRAGGIAPRARARRSSPPS